ncbi:hypothetical protein HPB49_004307 [Dermacentor silvarum]|uniref:Uncharacterized protein n=1 Tax=Dermacentor silvarum TaxID=543639 RepID=A0ACB8DVC1_DERSI|nr:hypothetical protein HPB49_004307 [Dermacentor silvarum]
MKRRKSYLDCGGNSGVTDFPKTTRYRLMGTPSCDPLVTGAQSAAAVSVSTATPLPQQPNCDTTPLHSLDTNGRAAEFGDDGQMEDELFCQFSDTMSGDAANGTDQLFCSGDQSGTETASAEVDGDHEVDARNSLLPQDLLALTVNFAIEFGLPWNGVEALQKLITRRQIVASWMRRGFPRTVQPQVCVIHLFTLRVHFGCDIWAFVMLTADGSLMFCSTHGCDCQAVGCRKGLSDILPVLNDSLPDPEMGSTSMTRLSVKSALQEKSQAAAVPAGSPHVNGSSSSVPNGHSTSWDASLASSSSAPSMPDELLQNVQVEGAAAMDVKRQPDDLTLAECLRRLEGMMASHDRNTEDLLAEQKRYIDAHLRHIHIQVTMMGHSFMVGVNFC